ncbi:MAG: hypothetical protein HYY13_01065 [Nitrospirae bacterium]|nr:hypothetical protein [Nitrospirota bacterium]
MSPKGLWFCAALAATVLSGPVYAAERTITLTDREILQKFAEQGEKIARLEEAVRGLDKRIDGLDKRIDGLENSLNRRMDGLQQQINELRQTMMWGFGVLFVGMMGLIGFVLWDRRTALAPAVRETERIKLALQEFAKKEPKLAETLRSLGLL